MNTIKKNIITYVSLVFFTFSAVSCGYLLHPNRRGGNHTSTLDPMIVLFDVLWLIPGFIPGVVAILVDSISGTWYYAPGENPDLVVGQKPQKSKTPIKLYAGVPFNIKFKTHISAYDKIAVKFRLKGKSILIKSYTADKNASSIPLGFIIPKTYKGQKSEFSVAINGKTQFTFPAVIN